MAIKPIAIGTSTGGNSDVSVEDSNGSLVFRPNGTEQMRIDTTGALTLGSALAVAEGGTGVTALSSLNAADLGSGAATDGYVLTADGAGNAAWEAASGGGTSLPIDLLSSGASIRKSDGTTAVLSESGGAVTLENASLGDTVLMPDNSNNVSTAPGIRFEADTDTGIGLVSAGNLAVVTGGSERMRIDSSGNVLVNTTTPTVSGLNDGYLTVDISNAVKHGLNINSVREAYSAIGIRKHNTSGTSYAMYIINSSGSNVGSVSMTHSAVSFNTSSDYRLKEDWQPMSGSIDRLKALKPVNFAWKVDGSRVDGFLAHEAQEVVPEAVTGEKDAVDADGNPEYQGIDQAKLVPLLTAALQETLMLVETQSAKIDALETRIQALEA